jgi:GAF domain-containing protein
MKKAAEQGAIRENLVDELLDGWQRMLNLATELLVIPAGMITRISGQEIEIILASQSETNPYQRGYKAQFSEKESYCEWVAKHRKTLLVPDSRLDPQWKENPAAVELGMVSYLGMPIMLPDGELFGTICFFDTKQNPHNEIIIRLVEQFKYMMELSLSALFTKEELLQRDQLVEGLSRIFPICAYCKKVCNENSEWVPVENYIKGISGKRASHGICPQCYEKEIEKESVLE